MAQDFKRYIERSIGSTGADIPNGTTDADLTLSNLSNVATARTNLDVYSKAEGDARYVAYAKLNFHPQLNDGAKVVLQEFTFF